MINSKTCDDWQALAEDDPGAVVRALVDWVADVLTVMRAAAVRTGYDGLLDASPGSAYRCAERAHGGLSALAVGGGRVSTDVTPEMLARWAQDTADPAEGLRALADEIGRMLYALNVVSASPALGHLASSAPDMVYRHVEDAHRAVLTLLTGSAEDGEALHDLWSGSQESTEWNLQVLAEDKRAASVIVAVPADDGTATVTLPGGSVHDAGRVAGGGLLWVADEYGDVIGHHPSWEAVGRALVEHCGLGPDTPVLVDYPPTPAADT